MAFLASSQQLRYLLALAEHLHFGRAAQACAVTQSTLSAGILSLERALDVEILDRQVGKRVVFTTLGTDLIARARTAVSALEAVTEAAAAARAPMTGRLRLGVIPTIGSFLLPRLMPALREAFPRLQLYLREDTTGHLVERLQSNRLDLALLALPCARAGADILPVARDEFLVALPAGHPLGVCEQIPVQALASEPLLLLEEGHCLRDQALLACGLLGAADPTPEPFAATTLHTLVQMVAGGLGVTLLPRIAVDAGVAAGTGILLRPLAGAGAWRTLGIAWREGTGRAGEYRALAPAIEAVAAPLG